MICEFLEIPLIQMNNPLISVITVVYNGASTLEQTILSVINQTYKNIEYIIIDGGSTDGTVDIIKKYEKHLAYWVSEPDNGIYDAMNKGIDKATGEWLNFMNSGDCFYDKNILEDINFFIESDVIYGNVCIKDKYGEYTLKPQRLKNILFGMVFSHQSTFVKRTSMQIFDVKYKIAADYNLFYTLYRLEKKFKYIPLTVSIYDGENGISSICFKESMKERYIIQNKHIGILFYIHLGRIYFSKFCKSILPNSFIVKYKTFKNKKDYI
jgi:glycosyltransferase involved in cell wall biosynthesis